MRARRGAEFLLRFARSPRHFAEWGSDFLNYFYVVADTAADAEMVGEFLECLKCFGLGANGPLVRAGTDFLLDGRNADGSRGDTGTDSVNANYHTTPAAAGGLTRVRWRASRLAIPELKTLLRPGPALPSWSLSSAGPRSGGRRVARPLP